MTWVLNEIVAEFAMLERLELLSWIEEAWIKPVRPDAGQAGGQDDEWVFSDIDRARVRLIYELRYDLSVERETLPLLLSLLDQLYQQRRQVRWLGAAIQHQPGEIRQAIAEYLERQIKAGSD